MNQAYAGPPDRVIQDVRTPSPADRRLRAGAPVGALSAGMIQVQAFAAAGNQAIAQLVASVQRQDPPGQAPGSDAEALISGIALANKSSAFKVKVTSRPGIPTSPLEIKKLGIELDGQAEVMAPDLSAPKAPVKATAGTQNTATSETDPKAASAKETRARVYAAELSARIPGLAETKARDALKFKTVGEYTPGRAGKASAGVALDTEYVSGEVAINFLQVDLAAKDPADRFKPLTATIKLGSGKMLEHTFPRAVLLAQHNLDVKLRLKVSGTIEIGPRWQDLESDIIKRFGQKALADYRTSMLKTIATEEAWLMGDKLAEKVAREATEGIADTEIRELAFHQAKEKALAAAEERGVKDSMVRLMMKEIGTSAGAKTDMTAVREAMRVAAESGAREAFELIGKSVVREAVKDALKLSARRLGAGLLGALVLGPVDIALVGIELLGNVLVEFIRSQEIKEVGMTAQLVRDNYVGGYRAGLVGGGGGSAAGAASSSPEGAAYLGGVGDGAKQLQTMVDAALKDRPEVTSGAVKKEDVVAQVKEVAAGLEVSTTRILAVASPRLQELLEQAYVKANSGGVFNWLFGSDVRESKSFKQFQDVVSSNLQPGALRTTTATLANKVKLVLTSLDYTGENARWFRTADGAHRVRMAGQTTSLSGWVTDGGTPLEDLYPNPDSAAATEAGGPAHEAKMASILRASQVRGFVYVTQGTTRTSSLTLTHPEAKAVGFEQWMRTPAAQGTSLGSLGQMTVNVVYTPSNGHPAPLSLYRTNGKLNTPVPGDMDNLKKYAAELGLDPADPALAQTLGARIWSDRLASTALASFPTPTILPG